MSLSKSKSLKPQMNADMPGAMKVALQKGTWMAALFSVGPLHQRLSAV
jgi:hypothetical protein